MSEKQKVIAKFIANLVMFGRVLLPSMATKPSPQMHFEIAQLLMDPTKRKVCIKAPRGFGKSSLVACVYVLWHIFLFPGQKYVIIQSKNQREAIKRLKTIKNILEYNERFISLFGYWGEQTSKKWTEERVELKDGTVIEAVGTGQQVRGLKEDHQRPTLFILDDPEDENNTKTAEAMNNNFDNLLAAIPGLDVEKGKVVVIGTPLHQLCIVERLKDVEGWEYRHYRAIEDGKSIWEEYFSTEYLLGEKKSLESANRMRKWYSEYMCEIQGDAERFFKEEYFRKYESATEFKVAA